MHDAPGSGRGTTVQDVPAPTSVETRPAACDAVPTVPDSVAFDRVLLRRYADTDVAAFVAAVRESTQTVGRWMGWARADYRDDEALAWFACCREERAAGTAHEFGLFDKATGAFLGGAGLNLIDWTHRYCNLGYWVRQSRQREGIARCAVRALQPVAFGPLRLNRVEIVVAVGNEASAGLARAAGAHFEGIARNRVVIDDVPHAASMFSLVP